MKILKLSVEKRELLSKIRVLPFGVLFGCSEPRYRSSAEWEIRRGFIILADSRVWEAKDEEDQLKACLDSVEKAGIYAVNCAFVLRD
ncbi:hypothetical protein HHK36_022603 [Tetracentron sinense]|uniref:Uncharacterized protein n=1 Tax=Tetracentron sinense TaxID=13715 RepID=A0A834YS91_TETSI|nr:hypothetical protein HHK36_022603 [Tetracentron sinense]